MTFQADERRLDDELKLYSETRDRDLRDMLIAANMPLVEQLARRFANRGEPFDDLVQAGSIGLIKAVDRFDPALGFAFDGYAAKTIIGEIKRHFRDRGWSIRAPRRIQELYLELGQTIEELSQRHGRSPTLRELAEEVRASEDDVVEALEAGHAYRSASLDFVGQEGTTLGQRLGAEDGQYGAIENRMALLPQVAALPERERNVIHLRFVEDLTQSEIAERLGVSQMQVSRLLARAVATLHRAMMAPASPKRPAVAPETAHHEVRDVAPR